MPPLTVLKLHLIGAIAAISVKPDPSALPGTSALEKLSSIGSLSKNFLDCGLNGYLTMSCDRDGCSCDKPAEIGKFAIKSFPRPNLVSRSRLSRGHPCP